MSQKYSQTSGVPLSLAVFLATDHYDHNKDEYTISATTIIKPVRQIVLAARVPEADAFTPLADVMSSRIGTAIHNGIEQAWLTNYKEAMAAIGIPARAIKCVKVNPTKEEAKDPDVIPVYMEQRLSRKVGKWTVTGKFDFVGQGRLEDFKTTTSYVVMKKINDAKFAKQGSIYRWLDPELITNPNMAIQFIILDWAKQEAVRNPEYPQQRFLERILPLAPVQETDHAVRTKLADIEKYWDASEEDIPLCDDETLQRTEPVYKYYASGDTTAAKSSKNFDSKQEAYIWLSEKGKGAIKEVPGQVTGCRFCNAFPVCTQKDALIASGELVL